MKISNKCIRKPEACLQLVALVLPQEVHDTINNEMDNLRRKLYRAQWWNRGYKQYSNRLDRRKARHQKRHVLRDAIENMHEDMFLDYQETMAAYYDDGPNYYDSMRDYMEYLEEQQEELFRQSYSEYDSYYEPIYDYGDEW